MEGNANRQGRIENGGNNSPSGLTNCREEKERGGGGEKWWLLEKNFQPISIEFPSLFSPFSFPPLFLKSFSSENRAALSACDCSRVNTRATEVKVRTPFDTTHFHPARERNGGPRLVYSKEKKREAVSIGGEQCTREWKLVAKEYLRDPCAAKRRDRVEKRNAENAILIFYSSSFESFIPLLSYVYGREREREGGK